MDNSLRRLIERGSMAAEQQFKELGKVTASWLAVDSSGNEYVIPPPPARSMDEATHLLREVFAHFKVVRYCHMDEVWMVEARSKEEVSDPGDHPDRQERVMIHAEDRDEGFLLAFRRIDRANRALGPLEVQDWTDVGGRMANLLPPRSKRELH